MSRRVEVLERRLAELEGRLIPEDAAPPPQAEVEPDVSRDPNAGPEG
jgi:hypothetical protein